MGGKSCSHRRNTRKINYATDSAPRSSRLNTIVLQGMSMNAHKKGSHPDRSTSSRISRLCVDLSFLAFSRPAKTRQARRLIYCATQINAKNVDVCRLRGAEVNLFTKERETGFRCAQPYVCLLHLWYVRSKKRSSPSFSVQCGGPSSSDDCVPALQSFGLIFGLFSLFFRSRRRSLWTAVFVIGVAPRQKATSTREASPLRSTSIPWLWVAASHQYFFLRRRVLWMDVMSSEVVALFSAHRHHHRA